MLQLQLVPCLLDSSTEIGKQLVVLLYLSPLFAGVMDEKMSATAALGSYAEACPQAFMPYVEQTLAILSDMSHYWHDEARAAAYDSLQKLILATHKVFPPATANGNTAASSAGMLSQQTKVLVEAAVPLLTSPVEDDVSKVAVTAAVSALGHLFKELGQGSVEAAHLEAAANMAKSLLENTALCQVGTKRPQHRLFSYGNIVVGVIQFRWISAVAACYRSPFSAGFAVVHKQGLHWLWNILYSLHAWCAGG